MSRDVLTYGWVRPIGPGCHDPEDIKVTYRHCGYEYPQPSSLAQALWLALGVPIAIAVVLGVILITSLRLNYVLFPVLAVILRV
jgi:hypothetical protein